MSDPLLRSYQLYVYRVRNFLFLGGVLPSSSIRPVVSYCTAFFTTLICCGLTGGVLYFCFYNIKDLNTLTKGISFGGSLVATALKAMCFIVNREGLIELHETLDEMFETELKQSPKIRGRLLSLLHNFDRPSYILSFSIGATISMYVIPPTLSILYQSIHYVEIKKYGLPFPAKFPWTIVGGSFLYQLHYLYEIAVAWFLLFTNCGVDALFGFYIFQMASLLRAMTYRLKNPQPGEDRLELLRTCVDKHKRLIRCRNILQKVYGPIILYLMLTNGVIMCALIFQAFQTKEMTFGKAVLFVFFMFLKIVQTFMYAWYGGNVATESEKFRQGLYLSDWTGESSKKLKPVLIITMLQKPMSVTILRFFCVSVDMFTKIMNTAVSYFFLLKTLDESE